MDIALDAADYKDVQFLKDNFFHFAKISNPKVRKYWELIFAQHVKLKVKSEQEVDMIGGHAPASYLGVRVRSQRSQRSQSHKNEKLRNITRTSFGTVNYTDIEESATNLEIQQHVNNLFHRSAKSSTPIDAHAIGHKRQKHQHVPIMPVISQTNL